MPKDVKRFVEECRRRKIVISGIEAMQFSDNETSPVIDSIADFSYATDSNKSFDDSLSFLSQSELSTATDF